MRRRVTNAARLTLLLGVSMLAASGHAAIAAPAARQADMPPPPDLPPAPPADPSPWDGDWVLSQTRNPPQIKAQAAAGYRFHITADGRIRWEIPSLHEVVEGRLDGALMQVHREGTHGLTLGVSADGPQTLRYRVFRDGVAVGEGHMTLAEQDAVWVDFSGPPGRPDLDGVVVYVRPGAQDK